MSKFFDEEAFKVDTLTGIPFLEASRITQKRREGYPLQSIRRFSSIEDLSFSLEEADVARIVVDGDVRRLRRLRRLLNYNGMDFLIDRRSGEWTVENWLERTSRLRVKQDKDQDKGETNVTDKP